MARHWTAFVDGPMDYVSDAVAPAVGPVVDKADNSGLVDGFTKSFGCIFRKLMSPTEWITSVMNPARLAKRGQKSAASGTTPGAAITDLLLGECMDDSFDKTKLPNVLGATSNPKGWIRHHNRALDRGMKFMMNSKSPLINWTDIMDLDKFGCYNEDYQVKYWWWHPEIRFGVPLFEIKVNLVDENTGAVKWNAMYNVEGQTWLPHDREPLGGTHPFFLPDWCPGPSDRMAHNYTLTVENLGMKPHPQMGVVGKMQFTQYPRPLLDATYTYERDIDPDDMVTRVLGNGKLL